MATQNAKKLDFDYYLTNLDWGDGSPVERDIKQFDRNEVFDHTYEKPGFYSIKGLVFKFEKVMLDATPFVGGPERMYDGYINKTSTYPEDHPSEGEDYHFVESGGDVWSSSGTTVQSIAITEYTSSASQVKFRQDYEDKPWQITEPYYGDNPVRRIGATGTNGATTNGLGDSWINTVVATYGKRTEGRRPGLSIKIPIKLDISEIDRLYYSFEVNLANPNGEDNPSEYTILEESFPPKIVSTGTDEDSSADDQYEPDWGKPFRGERIIEGMGGNSNDPNRDTEVKNGGWQRVTGYIFVQESDENIDSNGNNIGDLNWQVDYTTIQIYPRTLSDTPQDEDMTTWIGLRNLVIRTPNTINLIRPVEWQRFYSNMIVNPRDDYQSSLYELNDFAMIGGVSEKSSHFKTLTALAAFDNDDKEYRNNSLISGYNPYDFIAIYDTMAKYNADYYNEVLDPYTNPIHEDYAPYWRNSEGNIKSLANKPKIHGGIVDRDFHGVFKDTELVDVDLSTTKVHKGVIPLWEQMGLQEENNVPTEQIYWKNIIPKNYKLTDRSGFSREPLEDPTKGSITPRIPRLVWIIDEENDQTWNGDYYWPQLPKMTKGGVFTEPIDLNQYGAGIITSDQPIDETFFNLTFDADGVDELLDITDNYNIEYRTDGLLDLDENGRVDLLSRDISDTLEKDFDRQAF